MAARDPILIVNPRSDEAFVALVRQLQGGAATAADLEGELRKAYPRARVRERDLAGEPRATWYVYREGRWIASET
jgi:hypothetical protein